MSNTTTGRARSYTVSTDHPFKKEHIKRKREQVETMVEVFTKSKKTIRSPIKAAPNENSKLSDKQSEQEMEDLMKLMVDMKKTMEEGFNNNNEELKKLRKDIQEKEENWKQEKSKLESKINLLENRIEQKDRYERRNNIVIKGLQINKENAEKEVEEMIKKNIGVEVKVIEAISLDGKQSNKIILAKLEHSRQKNMLMKNKYKLRGTTCYIENDLTKEEQEIQRKIVTRAKEERNKGLRIRIGYKKLIIEGKKYTWNATDKELQPEQTVEESKNRQTKK